MTATSPGDIAPGVVYEQVAEQMAQVRLQGIHIDWALSRAQWALAEAGQFIRDIATIVRLDQAT